jgi:Putative glucoamylase
VAHLRFIPTFAGGMFEGLMANLVVPETSWGPESFGLADRRWAEVQRRYATQTLGYPVWGISPSSTADDTGGYGGYGIEGLRFGPGQGLALCGTPPCATEDVVSPHASAIALTVIPDAAAANLAALRSEYPGIYSPDGGFYDAVNPTTGAVGHRRLVLDQSMIMAALDDALNDGGLQRYFARDPESWAARLYLGYERMSLR